MQSETYGEQPDESQPAWWPAEYSTEFPHWHVWRGVGGLLYGRRLMSSPPRVVRAESVEDLGDQIRSSEADKEVGVPFGLRHGSV